MYDWMDGRDWLWMTLSMTISTIVIGVVVYAAVRLANRDSRSPK